MRTIAAVSAFFFGIAHMQPAYSADLGGDCCADLEDRIAELEATVARKGNTKVSLEISGQVNQAILAWDDGGENGVYQVANSQSGDRFRFTGSASIAPGLKAGYYLELGMRLDSSSRVDQFNDDSGDGSLNLRQSLWFVDSKTFGALSVGLGSAATDDIISYNLGGTNVAASANAPQFGGNFFTRDSTAGSLNSLVSGSTISLRWRRFAEQLDTKSEGMIRYDSPIFSGFAASASWGGDDYWDIALRYARDTSDYRVALGIGYYANYEESDDTLGWPRGGDTEPNGRNTEIKELKGSLSFLHKASGLFASAAYVHREFEGSDPGVLTFACFGSADAIAIQAAVPCGNRPDYDYYWLNAGIRLAWLPFGSTNVYGEYGRSEDAITGLNVAVSSAAGGDLDFVTESTFQMWGIGLVQEIRPASMEIYLSFRHLEASVRGLESNLSTVTAPIDDAQLFMVGSRIRF